MSNNNNENNSSGDVAPYLRDWVSNMLDSIMDGAVSPANWLIQSKSLVYTVIRGMIERICPEILPYCDLMYSLGGSFSKGGWIAAIVEQAVKSGTIGVGYKVAMAHAISKINNRLSGKENADDVTDKEMKFTGALIDRMSRYSKRPLFDPESLGMIWYLSSEMEKAATGQLNDLEKPLKEILGIDLVTINAKGRRESAFSHVAELIDAILRRVHNEQAITLTEEEKTQGLTLKEKQTALLNKIFKNELMTGFIIARGTPEYGPVMQPHGDLMTIDDNENAYTAEAASMARENMNRVGLTPETMLSHYAVCFILDPNYRMLTPDLQLLAHFLDSLGLGVLGIDKSMLWVFAPTPSDLKRARKTPYPGQLRNQGPSWEVYGAPIGRSVFPLLNTKPDYVYDPSELGRALNGYYSGAKGGPRVDSTKKLTRSQTPFRDVFTPPQGQGTIHWYGSEAATPPPGTIISYHPGPYPGGMVPDYLTRTPEQQQLHWEGHDLIAAAQHRDYPNLGVPAEQLYPPPTIRTQTNITLAGDINISAPNLDTRGLGEQEVRGTFEGAFKDMVDPNNDPPFLG